MQTMQRSSSGRMSCKNTLGAAVRCPCCQAAPAGGQLLFRLPLLQMRDGRAHLHTVCLAFCHLFEPAASVEALHRDVHCSYRHKFPKALSLAIFHPVSSYTRRILCSAVAHSQTYGKLPRHPGSSRRPSPRYLACLSSKYQATSRQPQPSAAFRHLSSFDFSYLAHPNSGHDRISSKLTTSF